MPGAGVTVIWADQAQSNRLALKPCWREPAVRNSRDGDGNVGIKRANPGPRHRLPDPSAYPSVVGRAGGARGVPSGRPFEWDSNGRARGKSTGDQGEVAGCRAGDREDATGSELAAFFTGSPVPSRCRLSRGPPRRGRSAVASGSWGSSGGQRASLGASVAVTGATDGATAVGGDSWLRSCAGVTGVESLRLTNS